MKQNMQIMRTIQEMSVQFFFRLTLAAAIIMIFLFPVVTLPQVIFLCIFFFLICIGCCEPYHFSRIKLSTHKLE